MPDKDKTDLEKVIPETAKPSLKELIQGYNTNCLLDIADYLYVMCRLAGHFDNLQKKNLV